MPRLLALLLILPAPVWAEVCDKERPFWTPGSPATAWDEFLALSASPLTMILLFASLLAFRFRASTLGLLVVLGWTGLVSLVVFGRDTDPTGIHQLAVQEGCVGSPALFIGVVIAICGAMMWYTAPRNRDADKGES